MGPAQLTIGVSNWDPFERAIAILGVSICNGTVVSQFNYNSAKPLRAIGTIAVCAIAKSASSVHYELEIENGPKN
jgi:hypothetical protein